MSTVVAHVLLESLHELVNKWLNVSLQRLAQVRNNSASKPDPELISAAFILDRFCYEGCKLFNVSRNTPTNRVNQPIQNKKATGDYNASCLKSEYDEFRHTLEILIVDRLWISKSQ